jgi:hypothetical protein
MSEITLLELPTEIIRLIALELSDNDIVRFGQTHSAVQEIVQDVSFWYSWLKKYHHGLAIRVCTNFEYRIKCYKYRIKYYKDVLERLYNDDYEFIEYIKLEIDDYKYEDYVPNIIKTGSDLESIYVRMTWLSHQIFHKIREGVVDIDFESLNNDMNEAKKTHPNLVST